MSNMALSSAASTPCPQPWISNARSDCLLIIAPAFITSVLVLLLHSVFATFTDVPVWAWVCLVLFVDVAHVYATLYRTYFDRQSFRKNRILLLAIPAVCWAVGCLLYSVDGLIFWRALAYLAVFHFIRQQYGFMVLYSRKDPVSFANYRWLDSSIIYLATIYPLLYWHTHLPRTFNWFVNGDFVTDLPSICTSIGAVVYALVAALYLVKEAVLLRSSGFFNWPRNLIIAGTALSWWAGIVSVNSDLAFTMTNILSHGIPYMALIWMYQHKTGLPGNGSDETPSAGERKPANEGFVSLLSRLTLSHVAAFIGFLVLLAYLEEGLWDGLVWREHLSIFAPFWYLPPINKITILAFVVPLLALPQSTHYVLDGFIWRVKDRTSTWSA